MEQQEELPKKSHHRRAVSRETLIKELQTEITNNSKDKIQAIKIIADLKGYFDDPAGELNAAKPIYIVTGSRPKEKRVVRKIRSDVGSTRVNSTPVNDTTPDVLAERMAHNKMILNDNNKTG